MTDKPRRRQIFFYPDEQIAAWYDALESGEGSRRINEALRGWIVMQGKPIDERTVEVAMEMKTTLADMQSTQETMAKLKDEITPVIEFFNSPEYALVREICDKVPPNDVNLSRLLARLAAEVSSDEQ